MQPPLFRKISALSFFVFSLLFFAFPAFALDLGGTTSENAEPQKVQVVNTNEEPVPVAARGTHEVREIVHETQLSFGEDYESSYIDVSDYHNVSFYVIPQKALNEPQPNIRYKLDAFFSVDTSTTTYKKAGERDEKLAGEGWQQFGNMMIRDENPPGQPAFTFLTTGETGSRILSTPVYGPFVRIVLKSLTESDRRKFRIVAFLSR